MSSSPLPWQLPNKKTNTSSWTSDLAQQKKAFDPNHNFDQKGHVSWVKFDQDRGIMDSWCFQRTRVLSGGRWGKGCAYVFREPGYYWCAAQGTPDPPNNQIYHNKTGDTHRPSIQLAHNGTTCQRWQPFHRENKKRTKMMRMMRMIGFYHPFPISPPKWQLCRARVRLYCFLSCYWQNQQHMTVLEDQLIFEVGDQDDNDD